MDGGVRGLPWLRMLLLFLCLVCCVTASAADLKEAQTKFQTGDYAGCIKLAEAAVHDQDSGEDWPLLLSQALLATGKYPEALTVITNALMQDRWNIRLCWQAREVFQSNGQPDLAGQMVEKILQLVSAQPRDYRDARSLVVFGEAALLKGADPKRVLDSLFNVAQKAEPALRDVYLASGNLALEKQDFALAAKRFEEGLKQVPDDPDLEYGVAQAYAPSDAGLMSAALERALGRNSNHVGCLLLLLDHGIDAEEYVEVGKLLDRVMAINPSQHDGWAD